MTKRKNSKMRETTSRKEHKMRPHLTKISMIQFFKLRLMAPNIILKLHLILKRFLLLPKRASRNKRGHRAYFSRFEH